MGLSNAISGSIIAFVMIAMISSISLVSWSVSEITDARQEYYDNKNKFAKTEFEIPTLLATAGEQFVNFTLINTGAEKLWSYEDFDVFVSYDANVGGVKNHIIEKLIFNENTSFIGSKEIKTTSCGTSQFMRPSSDVTTGSWTSTPLYQKIDETTRDDADFIQSPTDPTSPGNDVEISLSSISDPNSSSCHTLRYTFRAGTSGEAGPTLTVSLMQGSTTIASWNEGNISSLTSWQLRERSLSSLEIDSITDYSDLRIIYSAATVDEDESAHWSWAELEAAPTIETTTELTCISNSNFVNNNWIIANITIDGMDPKIINSNEIAHICAILSNPVYTTGTVKVTVSSDIGKTNNKTITII